MVSVWFPTFPTDRVIKQLNKKTNFWDNFERWENKPIIMGKYSRGIQKITAVNQVAERIGIRPGMLVSSAKNMTHDIGLFQSDFKGDLKALNLLVRWCSRYSPCVAIDDSSPDPIKGYALWLDISGASHLLGGERELVLDLSKRLRRFGFENFISLADTLGAAWAVARFSSTERQHVKILEPGQQEVELSYF